MRGGKEYIPPYGAFRIGLKAHNVYGEDSSWLGSYGQRVDSDPNEWPVAYHGTSIENVIGILTEGFSLEKANVGSFGIGIYCSPCHRTSLGYAKPFVYEQTTYQAVFQCRINPEAVKEHDRIWLVPNGTHIRPYGLCIYRNYMRC
uniref:PARP catalytic domain-containing protein n=1 Tax=Acrobeloides nanus TaxID=290746 RepID=A0A914EMZ7_9BILA